MQTRMVDGRLGMASSMPTGSLWKSGLQSLQGVLLFHIRNICDMSVEHTP